MVSVTRNGSELVDGPKHTCAASALLCRQGPLGNFYVRQSTASYTPPQASILKLPQLLDKHWSGAFAGCCAKECFIPQKSCKKIALGDSKVRGVELADRS